MRKTEKIPLEIKNEICLFNFVSSYDAEEKKYYCGHPMVEDAANWASLRISRHVINALLTLQTAS